MLRPGGSTLQPKVFSPEYVKYKNPSSSLCLSYTSDINAAVRGSDLPTKRKMAFSAGRDKRFRMT